MRKLLLGISVAAILGVGSLVTPSEAEACWGPRFARRCCLRAVSCGCTSAEPKRAAAPAGSEPAGQGIQIVNTQNKDLGVLLIRDNGSVYRWNEDAKKWEPFPVPQQ